MKQRKDSATDEVVIEKHEDTMYDAVVGSKLDLSLNVGFNGAPEQIMEEAGDDVVVSLEKDEVSKAGNGPVVEDSRTEVRVEIVEQAIESVEEVTGVESGQETEVLASSTITESLSITVDHGLPEGHVASADSAEDKAVVDETSKESLQSTTELTANDSKMAVESLFTEPHVQQVSDLDLVTNEKNGNDEVQDYSKKIAVVDEGLARKDDTQVGVSEDQRLRSPDNSSLSSDVVDAGTGEGLAADENATNLDQKVEVVENSEKESSQSTKEVMGDKDLDQKAEVGKEESSKSAIQFKTDDTLKSVEGNDAGDFKTDDETRSGDTEIADEEIDVIDKPEEPETKEIVEQPTDSVQEASDGDHVKDEKSGKETEVLNSSTIPESSTAASLELEEVDVVVVEEKDLEGKGEAQDSASVEPTQPSMLVDAGTGEDVVQVTESLDQKAEADATNKDESLLATKVADEVTTASVVACTEPDLSVDKMEIDTEASKVETLASGNSSNIQEDQQLIIADISNEQSIVGSGNETTVAAIEDTTAGGPQANAEHGVLPADSEISYEEGHMERGEDVGMDIDEVLGWKDEIKVDPTVFSLESEQLNETFASLQQSCYFQPSETEGEFSVSDLVWGKVRSHPWWPGQIFDPSDASEDAMKYYEKDCFLVAYFGDRTFAWNEPTVLKPFRSQFSKIEKHENSEAFSNAVHCALEEVSRRVEFGLTCSCIPQNVSENIKYQIVENSGISLESSKRRGIDKSASVSSFEPHKLVDYMRLLAKFPYVEGDKMELTLAKAQLSSYGRFKGYRQLAEFQLCGDLLEEHETYIEDGSKKRKALDSLSDGLEKRPTLHTEKPSFRVGACIQRVATQLTGPPLAEHEAGDNVSLQSPGSTRLGNQAYEGALLSQLHLAAQDPMKRYSFLNTIIPFFNNHRSAILNKSRQLANDARKRKALNENDPEEFEFDDVNDSYWTDRIIQNYPDENMLQENQNGGVEQHPHQQYQVVAYEQQHQQQPVKQTRRSNKKRFFSSNHEIEAKEQLELIERRRQNLATEVLMKYTEGIYFPSEIHLNKMFKRFGPLMESETEVDRQSGRARVVFKKCSDAEVAHSSAGKFNIFGSISVNYELNYVPLISYKPLPLPFGQDPSC